MHSSEYIGRFAPSPSGPLHFGSLVTALASYLDAKKNQGQWLVRIEDIDPPREQKGARDLILKALDVYGLHWDGSVVLQSQRLNEYKNALQELLNDGHAYFCICTRKALIRSGQVCTGQCYDSVKPPSIPYTLRLKCPQIVDHFVDSIYGKQQYDFSQKGNCILLRKDGFTAYQLAVVIDDIWQNITHVVRGEDLLGSTPWQLHLLKLFKQVSPPIYTHIPLVLGDNGKKLSKQHFSPAIPLEKPGPTLFQALQFLQLNPPSLLSKASVTEILEWGQVHWEHPSPSTLDHHEDSEIIKNQETCRKP